MINANCDGMNTVRVMRTPEDALYSKICGPRKVDLYIPSQGSDQINEVSDTTWLLGNYRLSYRYHDRGHGTFLVERGCVEVTLNGRKFLLEEGDMINIEPYMSHGFVFIDPDTLWREMYTDMNMWADDENRIVELPEPVDCPWVDKRTVQEVTCKGEGKITFTYEGICCLLKVGRWQLRGFKEIWEYQIEKGYEVRCCNATSDEGVYFVKSGRIMVKADSKTFFAGGEGEGTLIHIPAYTPYVLTAVADDCVIHDYNVSAHLFRLLEMIDAAKEYFPEKLDDPDYIAYLFEVNKVGAFTGFGRSDAIATDYEAPTQNGYPRNGELK